MYASRVIHPTMVISLGSTHTLTTVSVSLQCSEVDQGWSHVIPLVTSAPRPCTTIGCISGCNASPKFCHDRSFAVIAPPHDWSPGTCGRRIITPSGILCVYLMAFARLTPKDLPSCSFFRPDPESANLPNSNIFCDPEIIFPESMPTTKTVAVVGAGTFCYSPRLIISLD